MGREKIQTDREVLQQHVPDGGITFERVQNATKADIWVDGPGLSRTDETQEDFFLQHTHQRFWFMDPEFIGRLPQQVWQIKLGDMAIDTYNYASARPVTFEEVDVAALSIATFLARFPIPEAFRPTTIAYTDRFKYGNKKSSENREMALASRETRSYSIAISDGGLSTDSFNKNIPIPTRVGVHYHELAHFWWDKDLSEAWRNEGFTWDAIRTPIRNRPLQKDGRVQYVANRPDACITDYATSSEREDISESFAAYLGRAKHALHPAKRRLLDIEDYYVPPHEYEITSHESDIPLLPKCITYIVANDK